MIDRTISDLFPPIFIPESVASRVVFPWLGEPNPAASPIVLLVVQGMGCAFTVNPTPQGSQVLVTDEGVELHLSVPDALIFRGHDTLVGLWLEGGIIHEREPDKTGSLIISDWAFAPAKGSA